MDDIKRILVIEDDPLQRQLFKTALENAGYEMVDASDGKEGLQLFHHWNRPDLEETCQDSASFGDGG
jgi:CheY-like chemotaxis protein